MLVVAAVKVLLVCILDDLRALIMEPRTHPRTLSKLPSGQIEALKPSSVETAASSRRNTEG